MGMTCEDSILDPNVIPEQEHCNGAYDFDLIRGSDVRAPSLVWIVGGANTSSCAVTDAQCSSLLFSHAQPRNMSSALINLRRAVLPRYRRNLRWGMKNPQFTYMHKWLVRVFPCMVYVHTVRGVKEMVRNADHVRNRFNEAANLGLHNRFTEAASLALLPKNASLKPQVPTGLRMLVPVITPQQKMLEPVQAWLADYLLLLNSGLAWWASRCMPHQIVYLPVMTLSRCISDTCSAFHAERLARMLRLDPKETLRQVQAFAEASHSVTLRSHTDAMKRPLLVERASAALLRWPPPLSMLSGVESCKC